MKRILSVPASMVMAMIMGLATSIITAQAEQRPLLLSEVPSHQIYTSLELESKLNQQSLEDLKQAKKTSLTPLQKEYLLYDQLESLSADTMTAEDVARTKKLSKHQPQAYKVHDEGPLPIPVFDIQSLAKYKLYQYDVYQEQLNLQELVKAEQASFINNSLSSASLTEAARQVIQSLTSQDKVLTDSLVDSYIAYNVGAEQERPQLALLYTLATHTNSEEATRAVLLSTVASPLKSQLLNDIQQHLESYQVERLLKELIRSKSELSSQATLKYGNLDSSVRNIDFLVSLLDDQELGSSSALALARLNEDSVLDGIYSVITKNKASRTSVANGLLVLQQSTSAKAKDLLFRLIEQDKIIYSDMKQEVVSWVK